VRALNRQSDRETEREGERERERKRERECGACEAGGLPRSVAVGGGGGREEKGKQIKRKIDVSNNYRDNGERNVKVLLRSPIFSCLGICFAAIFYYHLDLTRDKCICAIYFIMLTFFMPKSQPKHWSLLLLDV
jgi:hypothetical protein